MNVCSAVVFAATAIFNGIVVEQVVAHGAFRWRHWLNVALCAYLTLQAVNAVVVARRWHHKLQHIDDREP